MTHSTLKKAAAIAFSGALLAGNALATDDLPQRATIKAVAVTGDNNRFQQPLYNLGPALGTGFFNWVFVYNPDGGDPLFMTEDMPGDSILVGGVDPVAQALGLAPSFVDPALTNIPLHTAPVTVADLGRGIGTGNRAQVPVATEYPSGAAVTRSTPNEPVTIDSWFRAGGTMKVVCRPSGQTRFRITMNNLIPNGVYTLWTIYLVDADGDGVDDGVAPYPLGGVPNVVIPDADGRAEVVRQIGFCPMTEEKLLFVDIAWHSDGNVYGGVPDLPFDPVVPQAMGMVTHTHLQFPFNVTPVE